MPHIDKCYACIFLFIRLLEQEQLSSLYVCSKSLFLDGHSFHCVQCYRDEKLQNGIEEGTVEGSDSFQKFEDFGPRYSRSYRPEIAAAGIQKGDSVSER